MPPSSAVVQLRTNTARQPQPHISVWHREQFPGLVFYRGAHVDHPYPRHWHDEVHLCAYTGGSGNLGYRGSSHRVVAGDFLLTPAGEVHSNWVDQHSDVSFRSVYVDLPVLRAHAEQITGVDREPDFPSLRIQNHRAQRSFLRMHRAMETSDSPLLREELLVDFFGRLIGECTDSGGSGHPTGCERAVVQRVRQYIDHHSHQSISLAELAREAQLSPFHLHRVFCRETGMPPHRYQTQVRINRSKELLRLRQDLPDIALAMGFADQSHFTRHFRRLVGVTPGQFRAGGGIAQDDSHH
jgi:AraC-like DNA-binding protein